MKTVVRKMITNKKVSPFQNELKERKNIVKPPTAKHGYDWHCIVMPKERNITQQSGNLKGHWSMKVKHLEKLGYKVHSVGPKQSIQFERKTNKNVTKSNVKSLLILDHIDMNK